MNIQINFKIKKRDYDEYESILQEFLNYMAQLGYDEIEIIESEN